MNEYLRQFQPFPELLECVANALSCWIAKEPAVVVGINPQDYEAVLDLLTEVTRIRGFPGTSDKLMGISHLGVEAGFWNFPVADRCDGGNNDRSNSQQVEFGSNLQAATPAALAVGID